MINALPAFGLLAALVAAILIGWHDLVSPRASWDAGEKDTTDRLAGRRAFSTIALGRRMGVATPSEKCQGARSGTSQDMGVEVTDLQVLGHGNVASYVTDIGCRSCGWWSAGFVMGLLGLSVALSDFTGLDGEILRQKGVIAVPHSIWRD